MFKYSFLQQSKNFQKKKNDITNTLSELEAQKLKWPIFKRDQV